MDDGVSSHTKRLWTYALILISVVSLVVVVVGLLLPRADPELTTAPTSSSQEPDPAAPEMPDVVEEPVDLDAPIPGCDVVETPDEGYSVITGTSGEPSYDNPKFPWFNGPKATEMSNAVAELLPSKAEIEFASPERSLIFQPITDFGEDTPDQSDGYTSANGSVINREAKGSLYVSVAQSSRPIPPCVAGALDERRTLPDGVLVDVQDTWRETDGVRTLSRSAIAYVPDNSRISAQASDASGRTGAENSGAIPVTVDDLVRIVTDPRLRISTPVPPGTPAPPAGCRSGSFDDSGPSVTREQARKLDTVLASIDLGGAKLPPLQLGRYSEALLCTGVPNVTPTAALDISITGGQKLPVEERPVRGAGSQKTLRTLADGTVVQTDVSFSSSRSMTNPDDYTSEAINSVVVTRPAGTQISVSSTAPSPDEALPLPQLESIALTPGLEL
ncbi:hypothetical protein [Gordonia rubripertincta]|uniref:Uncharacterized protein n=1 Tax=Gordonia rubripertincta TaxID=36822 RepID=A0ABT4N0L2_GORRU|nr:hypothetical protein [Gordonia rubripertincta]MCZ4551831.1 hypothetical protein [Gordonia rubripertincta]